MLTINQRFWWMTDSDVVWWSNQYSYGQWVDGKTYPDRLTLARKSEWSIVWTWTHLMFAQYDESFYFGEWGRVYNNAGTNVYTLPWNFPIRNVIKFGDNFLMFYSTWNAIRIARCPFVWSSPDFWSVTVQRWVDELLAPFQATYNTAVWPYCVAINDSEDILYFIAWQNVYRVLVTTAPFIEVWLRLEDDCVWLTKSWSQITVYLSRGKKYFWDGFSLQHDGYVELGEQIRYVQDTRNYDYMVSWSASSIYSKMYISQGQDFQLVRRWSFTLDWANEYWKAWYWMTGRYWNFCIWVDEDNVVASCDDQRTIESLWNRVVWLPKATSVDYYNDDVVSFGMVRRKQWQFSAWDFWFSYKDINWNAYIDTIQTFRTATPKYNSEWLLFTQKFNFGGTKTIILSSTDPDTLITSQLTYQTQDFPPITATSTTTWTDSVWWAISATTITTIHIGTTTNTTMNIFYDKKPPI